MIDKILSFYLVGEPCLLEEGREKEEFYAPAGQAALCQQVLLAVQETSAVRQKLREEYVAIIYSLKEMGIELRIIYSHEDKMDKQLMAVCVNSFGCKLAGFSPTYFPPGIAYPRDFAAMLPGLVLVNDKMVAEVTIGQKGDYRIIRSPYGEGGRMLFCDNTMLVSERLIVDEGKSIDAKKGEAINEIKKAGIKVGFLPSPVAGFFSADDVNNKIFFNDHLDRVACLLRGRDGKLHLVVDPNFFSADWKGIEGKFWVTRFPEQTIQRIKQACNPLGIEVHLPLYIQIPYALNLIQFKDNRVLMTGGDESVAEVVGKIVGEENVFKTSVPICFFPTWCYAGIRCLINEAPMVLFKHA